MLWRGLRFDWANVIFAAYFMLRLLSLVGMICPLLQDIFFHLFWNVKFFIAAK